MNVSQFGIASLPAGQLLIGIVQAQRLSLLIPGATAQIKRTIVDLAARLKGFIQASALRLGWIDSVLECFTHTQLCVNSSTYILLEQTKYPGETINPPPAKSRAVDLFYRDEREAPFIPPHDVGGFQGLNL